ncbi:MAG: hemolysin family protein [Chloroflexota bacterium]
MSKLLLLLATPGVTLFSYYFIASAAEGDLPPYTVLIIPAIVIIVLVVLNGFFVAAEIAIVGVRPSQVEHMAEEGDTIAGEIFDVVDSRQKQDKFIATAQLGITIASLGLAQYAEPEIDHFLAPRIEQWPGLQSIEGFAWAQNLDLAHNISYVVALSILTYLHVVIGEMVPKTLALMDSVNASKYLVRPMRFFQSNWVLGIPVKILNSIGAWLLRLFGVHVVEGHERVLTAEELELIVSESAEGGLLNEEEEEMIRNIFDFGDRTVGQVLTPRRKVQAIPVDMPYEEILAFASNSNHSRFPVHEENLDQIIGMIHIKDLARQSLKPNSKFDIRLMLRSIPVVSEDQQVEKLLASFKRDRQHVAVVLDEFGGMAGIVTLEDLVEEVVGEVRDEFDQEKEPLIEVAPGILEMTGEYLVDDLIEDIVFLGELEDLPDVTTVGGLIVAKLRRPPAVGDQVTYNDEKVRLKVLAIEGRAVVRVRLEYLVADDASGANSSEKSKEDETGTATFLEQLRERRKRWDS